MRLVVFMLLLAAATAAVASAQPTLPQPCQQDQFVWISTKGIIGEIWACDNASTWKQMTLAAIALVQSTQVPNGKCLIGSMAWGTGYAQGQDIFLCRDGTWSVMFPAQALARNFGPLPSCTDDKRGVIWTVAGTATMAPDTPYICLLSSTGALGWSRLNQMQITIQTQ